MNWQALAMLVGGLLIGHVIGFVHGMVRSPHMPLFSPDAEHCHQCGKAVGVVWTAPDDLWAAVTDRPDGGGILCVQCFDDKAVAQDRFIRWVPQQEAA